MADRPLWERYRRLAAFHEKSLRQELTEQWGHSDDEIDQFLRAEPHRLSVIQGESVWIGARENVEVDSIHELANGRIDSLLLDGLLLLQQAYKSIEAEEYHEVRRVLPLVYKYLDISRSECQAHQTREKKSKAGHLGADARWGKSEVDLWPTIERLSRMQDEVGDPLQPKELWPELFSDLDLLGLNPRECGNPNNLTDPTDPAYYEYAGGKIKYHRFREAIRQERLVG